MDVVFPYAEGGIFLGISPMFLEKPRNIWKNLFNEFWDNFELLTATYSRVGDVFFVLFYLIFEKLKNESPTVRYYLVCFTEISYFCGDLTEK